MRARRWLENALLLAGLLALDVWIWSHAGAVICQSWQNREFEREVQQTGTGTDRAGESSGSPDVGKTGGPVGRLTIPPLRPPAIVRQVARAGYLPPPPRHNPNTALPGPPGNLRVSRPPG